MTLSQTAAAMLRGKYRRFYAQGYQEGSRVNALSIEAEFCWTRLQLIADDYGNFAGCIHLIMSRAFPRRRDITEPQVDHWLQELSAKKLIGRYEVDGEAYYHLCDFISVQPAGPNGRRVRRCPQAPQESDEITFEDAKNLVDDDGYTSRSTVRLPKEPNASGCNKVKAGESGRIQNHPLHQHHNHNHDQNQQQSASARDAAAAESSRVVLEEELRRLGVHGRKAEQCAGLPGLTLLRLRATALEANDKGTKNKHGLLIRMLQDQAYLSINGHVPVETAMKMVRKGLIRSIGTVEVGQVQKAGVNHLGLNVILADGRSHVFHPDALQTDAIVSVLPCDLQNNLS